MCWLSKSAVQSCRLPACPVGPMELLSGLQHQAQFWPQNQLQAEFMPWEPGIGPAPVSAMRCAGLQAACTMLADQFWQLQGHVYVHSSSLSLTAHDGLCRSSLARARPSRDLRRLGKMQTRTMRVTCPSHVRASLPVASMMSLSPS